MYCSRDKSLQPNENISSDLLLFFLFDLVCIGSLGRTVVFLRFRKGEGKTASSRLSQSYTAEGDSVSVVEGKENVHGFSNTTDIAFAEMSCIHCPMKTKGKFKERG